MKPLLATLLAACWVSFASGNPVPSDAAGAQSATSAVSTVTVRATEQQEFDWAKLQAHAQIASISSGPRIQAGRMIDGDLRTAFTFSTSDSSPTVIVELAQAQQLHRISAVFKAEQARLDVFLLDKLPNDPRDLAAARPFASVTDTGENPGKISVNFSPSGARYIALRWIRTRLDQPFEVAEISAFSDQPTDGSDYAVHLANNISGTDGPLIQPPPITVASP